VTGTVVEAVIVGREIGSATSARLTTLHAAISASNVRPPKVKMMAVIEVVTMTDMVMTTDTGG